MKRMSSCLVFGLLAVVLGGLSLSGQVRVPRQFEAWGTKAPFKLGAYNAVNGKRHMESIFIPPEYKEVTPDTNTTPLEMSAEMKARSYLVFNEHYMTKVYPCTQPLKAQLDNAVKAFATPGEYVTMTFSIRTLQPLYNLRLTPSEFKCEDGGVIPLENIDRRLVKCLPWKTDKPNEYQLEPRYLETYDEFDIADIPQNTTQRVWITVKLQEDLKSGIYRGTVKIAALNVPEYTAQLAIRVLPFKLMKPDPYKDITFSILTNHNDPRITGWGSGVYNENMLRHFVDMVEHGLTSTGYFHLTPYVEKGEGGELKFRFDKPGFNNLYSMEKVMDCYVRAGLTGPFEYQKGPCEWAQFAIAGTLKVERYSKEYDEAFKKYVKAVYDKIQQEKWPEFIFVLGDEPGGHADRLKLHMHIGKLLKEVEPTIRTANYFNGEWGGSKDWLYLKPVTDINISNYTCERLLKESAEAGYKDFWLYNGCANYPSDYRGYRVFYGFEPWKMKAKGVTQFIQQAYSGTKGLDFNAYDSINNEGNCSFIYPSSSGPLPSPEWECVRQGIYDYRYIYTLAKMVDKAMASNDADLKMLAESAQGTMNEVMTLFPYDLQSEARHKYIDRYSPQTLDMCRWKIAAKIMELREAMKND